MYPRVMHKASIKQIIQASVELSAWKQAEPVNLLGEALASLLDRGPFLNARSWTWLAWPFLFFSQWCPQYFLLVAHEHGAYVSSGGWIEYVLTKVRSIELDQGQLGPLKLAGSPAQELYLLLCAHKNWGRSAVKDYLQEMKGLGFDVVELSSGVYHMQYYAGFITLPDEDLHRLIRDVHNVREKLVTSHTMLCSAPEKLQQWSIWEARSNQEAAKLTL
eukprot:429245-Pelagomonas_calceolata.AAC.1